MVCPAFQAAACDLGLNKGTIVAHEIDGHRCLLGLAHSSPISLSAESAAEHAVRKLHFRHLCARAQTLSSTQKELVYLFANGYKAKQVAAHFEISEDAIKQRKQIIQRVIGVNSFISTVNICSSAGITIHPIS
jgi:DNA-binding NarL/FixJ family response regulator